MNGLKLSVRTLSKTPFVTAVAVLSLALGIGANAAIFSLFDQMLLSALPVQNPEQLVNFSAPGPKPGSQSCNDAGDCDVVFSYPMFRDLEKTQASFTGIAAHRLFGANLSYAGNTRSGQGMFVSGTYFPVLGVRPALGRLLTAADDENFGAHSVVVLSFRYWENELGSDPSLLNQSIVINGQPMTIIGVAARGFRGTTLGSNVDIFVPITMRTVLNPGFKKERFEDRRNYWIYLFARLQEGTSLDQARPQINTLYRGIINDVEAPLQTGMSEPTMIRFRAREITLEEGYRGQSSFHRDATTPLTLLLGITGVVLLIACANIANLLLARGARRGQEMAVRGSLGANRRQLLIPLLTEALVLACLGGMASLLVANWTLGLIASFLPPEALDTFSFELSPSVVLFTALLSIATGFLFGLYPALHNTRRDLVTVLKANAGQPSGARSAARLRAILVTAQISLSLALLVAAGLFIKSLANVSRIELGLRSEQIVTFSLSPVLNGYKAEQSKNLFQQVEDELSAIPGVSSVTTAMVPVLGGSSWGTDVAVEGFEGGPDIDSNSRLNAIGPDYFRTLENPLLGGREFTRSDTLIAPKVAIINEAFARKFGLDSREAVGKWMSDGGKKLDIQIVGIAQDAKYNDVKQAVPPIFFTPYRQDDGIGSIYFYLRTAIDTRQVVRAIPGVVAKLDPNLPVDDLKTLDDQVEERVSVDRLISTLTVAFALLATLLAGVGLYGVIAYSVAQRTREIGLRIALGAGQSRIQGMVLKQVGRMILIGGLIGIAAALGIGRAAQSLLFGLEGHDPLVLILVTVALAGVAFGAGYLPARKASRVDPMQALRYE